MIYTKPSLFINNFSMFVDIKQFAFLTHIKPSNKKPQKKTFVYLSFTQQ